VRPIIDDGLNRERAPVRNSLALAWFQTKLRGLGVHQKLSEYTVLLAV